MGFNSGFKGLKKSTMEGRILPKFATRGAQKKTFLSLMMS